jgi:hypothetical protein
MMIEDIKDRGGSHYVVPKVKTAFRKISYLKYSSLFLCVKMIL